VLTVSFQQNILHRTWADPSWELPESIANLLWDLTVTKAWIATRGLAGVMTAEPDPPHGTSNGKSEVKGSGGGAEVGELPLPGWDVPKVQQGDLVKHTLDKGTWAAKHQLCDRVGKYLWKCILQSSVSCPFC